MMMKKILIVDDDADLRAAIRQALAAEFQVLEASSGRQAVELVGKERPQLVLLDVNMPEMTGIDAVGAIKESAPAAIVVMLTSEGRLEMACQALNCGATAYMTKPFELELLKIEIRRLLASPPEDKSGRPWRLGETGKMV